MITWWQRLYTRLIRLVRFRLRHRITIDEGLLVRAGLGDSRAQLMVGYRYEKNGDATRAIRWYKEAVELGNVEAMSRLGQMYHLDKVMEPDLDEAIRLYWMAIEHESPEAMYLLATIFSNEPGRIDVNQTLLLYRSASDLGHAGAQNNLGVMYHQGRGVVKNYEQAYFWFCISAANGDSTAKQNTVNMERYLNKERILYIQNRAETEFPKYNGK